MSTQSPVIVWFRRDLRVSDNAALYAAAQTGKPVLALYIREIDKDLEPGEASDWFLHYALKSLEGDLSIPLIIRRGKAKTVLDDIIAATDADEVHWGRRYGRQDRERDAQIKSDLKEQGLTVESHNTLLMAEPWEIKTGSGTNYKVFTPFYRKFRELIDVGEPLPAPELKTFEGELDTLKIDDLKLLPTNPDWGQKLQPHWEPGSEGAHKRLNYFLSDAVTHYAVYRDRPDYDRTSRMSAYLAHGCISPRECWYVNSEAGIGSDKFLAELGWREFSYSLLYYYPDLKTEPLNKTFESFKWQGSDHDLEIWQRGQTGFPIVDAGMRQLWETGWMHNRVRMIVASFLIKDLLVHWRDGEEWFWNCLCDADPASNAQGWQWTAGCGADASPYFRIFNPMGQGEKFDPMGDYVRKWCPELQLLPKKYIHRPWEAPDHVLNDADVTLGEDYPRPMVNHAQARNRALDLYKEMKS